MPGLFCGSLLFVASGFWLSCRMCPLRSKKTSTIINLFSPLCSLSSSLPCPFFFFLPGPPKGPGGAFLHPSSFPPAPHPRACRGCGAADVRWRWKETRDWREMRAKCCTPVAHHRLAQKSAGMTTWNSSTVHKTWGAVPPSFPLGRGVHVCLSSFLDVI